MPPMLGNITSRMTEGVLSRAGQFQSASPIVSSVKNKSVLPQAFG